MKASVFAICLVSVNTFCHGRELLHFVLLEAFEKLRVVHTEDHGELAKPTGVFGHSRHINRKDRRIITLVARHV